MATRTGKEYLAGLNDGREVWLGDEKVNVAEHPTFSGSLKGMAGYFDWQHKFPEECIVKDPETGEEMSGSLILPKNKDDLERRGRCIEQLAKYSVGMLGRTTDYINVTLAGYAMRTDLFEESGYAHWGENVKNFHREVVKGDLSLTHTILQPAIDKSTGELEGINQKLGIRVVERKKDSIVVRGCKLLGTLAPFADEIWVYPAGPLAEGTDPGFALSFAIPMNTPGLITVCRDHYNVDTNIKDQPFSSRFDEQDTVVIFNDVEIPNNRIFFDGDVEFYNKMAMRLGWYGNVTQQTAIRAAVKLEFAYNLCTRMTQLTNSDKRPEVTMMLGEIWSYSSLTRAALAAGLAGANDCGNGAYFLDDYPMRALIAMMPQWMVRVNDLIKTLGSHYLLATPTAAAFDNPEMGEFLREYLPSANGCSAEERAQIFRIAWDFAGSALGGRVELYERYYLASQPRNLMIVHMNAQNAREWNQVEEFMINSGIK